MADFPHYPIYNNPYKTPEEEEGFAHDAELDWSGITEAEQKHCVAVEREPQLAWDPDKLTGDNAMFFAPPMTYERLSICTNAAIQRHAQQGN